MNDIINLVLIIVIIAIPSWASYKVKSTYNKYSKLKVKSKMSGVEVARKILDKNGLTNVYVVETKGTLSDHYDPKRKVIKLSKNIFHDESVASVAVAAHEVGHAIQDKEGYTYMKVRSVLVPFVNFTTQIGYVVIFIAIITNLLELFMIGILSISVMLVFQLITLPVEFDASNRAFKELDQLGVLEPVESRGVKNMLFAAAMTYVAAVLTSALNILRFILIARGRD